MTIASAVIGFPGETEETAWETINFINSLNPDDIGFYIATPYPGTPMYEEVVKNGWLRSHRLQQIRHCNPNLRNPRPQHGKNSEKSNTKPTRNSISAQATCLKMMRRGGTYGRSGLKTSAAYALRAMHIKLS